MADPKVSLKISKHPTKPNTYLISPTVTVPFEGEPPAKEVIFVLDTSSSMKGTRIEKVKPATLALIKQLIPNKDYFSVVEFDGSANCIIPRKIVSNNDSNTTQIINGIATGMMTNVELGLLNSADQIIRSNFENTTIILLSDGEVSAGQRNAKLIVKSLKEKLGGDLVRIIPIGIGTDYSLEFMKALGLEAGFRGLIHLDDQADPQIAFTQVKPYLLPRTKSMTLSVTMSKSSVSEELGSIECNQPCSTVFELSLSNGKKLVDTAVKCNVVMGKEYKEFWFQPNSDATYDPEIIAKYYTQQYLIIVDQEISKELVKTKLTELFDQLNGLNLNEFQVIKDIKDKITQTIQSITRHNESAYRTSITTEYTNYTRGVGGGVRTQMSQKELVNVVGYNQQSQILEFNGHQFRALTEDVDLSDIAKNGRLYVSFDAAIHNREAIIFDTQSPEFKKSAVALTENIKRPDTLPTRLDRLCEFVRNNFNATDVDAKVKEFYTNYPQNVLKLTDGSEAIPCIPLEYFYLTHTGVCRHYAPFTACSIVHLIQVNLLPKGTVRIYRGTADNQKAHSWVHYHPRDGINEHLIFLIDPTNPGQKVFVFDLKKIRKREKDTDLENAIVNYRKRGLEGLLIEMLVTYNIPLPNIPPSENYQVSEELIRAIQEKIAKEKRTALDQKKSKTEDDLINAGVIDPISLEIIVEPVRTDDKITDKKNDKKQVYDRDFIAAWLVGHDTSPNTGAKLLSKTLTPAYDEVNRINGILARLLGIVKPEEVNSTIASYRRAELTEETKLAKLNERDNKVRVAIRNYEKGGVQKSRTSIAPPVSPSSSSSSAMTMQLLSVTPPACGSVVPTSAEASDLPAAMPAVAQSAPALRAEPVLVTEAAGNALQLNVAEAHSYRELQGRLYTDVFQPYENANPTYGSVQKERLLETTKNIFKEVKNIKVLIELYKNINLPEQKALLNIHDHYIIDRIFFWKSKTNSWQEFLGEIREHAFRRLLPYAGLTEDDFNNIRQERKPILQNHELIIQKLTPFLDQALFNEHRSNNIVGNLFHATSAVKNIRMIIGYCEQQIKQRDERENSLVS